MGKSEAGEMNVKKNVSDDIFCRNPLSAGNLLPLQFLVTKTGSAISLAADTGLLYPLLAPKKNNLPAN
ncbi:hypothetical protein [Pseudomonas sp. Irchel s3h17]|uniref:hypothetical protein n=1 Tax=Pseudomonas sp. Irchel s3h17 TaxID=2009182 RepID=UPI001179BACA|nr:hypothetical protein [Pseudomonas sp. Irchel s3h17]